VLRATQDNFTQVVNTFLDNLREFNKDVQQGVKPKVKSQFIGMLKELTRFDQKLDKNVNDDTFLNRYIEQYKKTNRLPKVGIRLNPYAKTIDDEYHRDKLAKTLDYLDPALKITKYDREIYKFDNILDEYVNKLNAQPINLGYVAINSHTLTWQTEPITKGVARYYKDFFKVDDISINNPALFSVIESYVTGLCWVFEYYFNHFDITKNRSNAYIWTYPFTQAPLMTQISQYLSKIPSNKLQNLCHTVINQTVPMTDFFNPLEHQLYVSPAPFMIDMFPTEYHEFIEKSGYYDVIKRVVANYSEYIDCRGALFLTKCHLDIAETSFNKDKEQLILPIRKIKLNPDTLKRTGSFTIAKTNATTFDLREFYYNQHKKYKSLYKLARN
jgi:hypothetical protein